MFLAGEEKSASRADCMLRISFTLSIIILFIVGTPYVIVVINNEGDIPVREHRLGLMGYREGRVY